MLLTRSFRALAVVLASAILLLAGAGPVAALPPDSEPHFVQVDAGRYNHAVVGLTSDGAVYTWGVGLYGELADGPGIIEKLTPSEIIIPALTTGDSVTQVSMGSEHALAVTAQGTVLAWGNNTSGQLGLGDTSARYTPTAVPATSFPLISPDRIVAVSASGTDHSLALSSSGQVFAWGWNGHGQLGDGSVANRTSPVRILNHSATAIAAGNGTSFAVITNGDVYSWGNNSYGQLGDGTYSSRVIPGLVSTFPGLSSGERIVDIAAGGTHVLAVASGGKVYSWGDDTDEQLGLGAGDDSRRTPALVTVPALASGDTVESVDAGDDFSLARTTSGALYTWGSNTNGQLGLGDTVGRDVPTPVTSYPAVLGSPIAWASAGHDGTVIVSTTGGVYGTGRFGGLLGDATETNYPVAAFTNVRLGDLSGTASLSAAPVAGVALSATVAGWNAGAVLAYQWQLGGSDIVGATSASYTPDGTDVGQQLRVVVTATAENYAPVSVTSNSAVVTAAAPDIQTLSLPPVTAGAAINIPIVATGTGPLYYSAPTIPPGVSIHPSTGVISGSLTVAGSYTVQVQVSSDAGVDTGYFTLSVVAGAVTQLTLTPSDATPTQGDTIEITVLGHDAYGNDAGNLTAASVFKSDVASDVIVGNQITFPHASPHTITASTAGVSQSIVIEVTPLAATLAVTGGGLPGWLAVACIIVLFVGALTLAIARWRMRPSV